MLSQGTSGETASYDRVNVPYCPSCGSSVAATARFCQNCGAAQPATGSVPPPPPRPTVGPFENVSPRNAATLCYVPWIGWIAALFVLAAERFRTMRDVRFHAFQGLYLAVAWLVLDSVAESVLPRGRALVGPIKAAAFALWIYMLYQTSRGVAVRLPLLGELADRSVDEQRA